LQTFRQVEKSRGSPPPELLNGPKLNDLHDNVWTAYTSLSSYSWTELKSYIELTGIDLAHWEASAVMELAKYREAKPKWPK